MAASLYQRMLQGGLAALAIAGIATPAALFGYAAAKRPIHTKDPATRNVLAPALAPTSSWRGRGLVAQPPLLRATPPSFVSHVGCIDVEGWPACADPIVPKAPLQGYIAVCTMFRDDPDVLEWVEHNRKLGIEALYLYEHNSTTPMTARFPIERLDQGDLRYEYINHFPNTTDMNHQMSVYADCLQIGRHHPWMLFHDADEFLVPSPGNVYLPDFMRQYEGECALMIEWINVGSNNHTSRPIGGLVENYTKCAPRETLLGHQTKIIANPQLIDDFIGRGTIQGPHLVYCINNKTMITQDGDPFYETRPSHVSMKSLVLYHYLLKSKEDMQQKLRLGGGTGDFRSSAFFEEVDRLAQEDCFEARDLSRLLGPSADAL